MPYLETQDGTEIHYNDLGSGTPIILIHGWPLDSGMWENQSNYLAEHGLRVITYDRRGFGKSGHPWMGYDYNTLAADLSQLIDKLDLRQVTLAGFSMGGGEVVRYLSRHGADRVKNAVLISAVTPCLMKAEGNPDGVDPKVFTEMEDQIRKDRPAFLKSFGPMFYGRSPLHHTVSEAILDWTFGMASRGSLRATLAAMKAWSMTDFRQEMPAIGVPVRVIHGTSDHTVPIDIAGRRSAKLLPDSALSEYDGEPHGLFITAKDRLNEELLVFAGGSPDAVTAADVS